MSQMIDLDETLKTIQQIMNSNISPRAKNLGIWIAVNQGLKSPKPFWVKQASLAQNLNCSKSSVGRALRELVQADLLIDINQKHQGRYKFYRLNTTQSKDPAVKILVKQWGNKWQKQFPSLDGRFGRPNLEYCLDHLAHRQVKNAKSKEEIMAQVESWLQNDADLWMPSYLKYPPPFRPEPQIPYESQEDYERAERLLLRRG
ncbi:MAG: helix-turn-helix domain-containing protein [Myxococcaceae bacterium]